MKRLFLVIFYLCHLPLFGQNVDSMVTLYQRSANDSAKIDLGISIAKAYNISKSPQAKYYIKDALENAHSLKHMRMIAKTELALASIYLSRSEYDSALTTINNSISHATEINAKGILSESYNYRGLIFFYKGDYQQAEKYYLQTLEYRKQINDEEAIGDSYNNLGGLYNTISEYEKAVRYFLESLKIKEKINNKRGIGMTSNNMANAYRKLGLLDKALEYQLKAVKIKEELGDEKGLSNSLGNLGNIYHDKGDIKQAIACYNRVLTIQKKLKEEAMIANAYNSLGFIHYEHKDYEKAMQYYEAAIQYYIKTKNPASLATPYINIGNIHLDRGNLEEAEKNFDKALKASTQSEDKEEMAQAKKGLAAVFSRRGNYEKSFEYMQQADRLQDSVLNIQSNKAIIEMQAKYDAEKKENAIRLLQKSNELKEAQNRNTIIVATGILLVLIAFGFLIYNSIKLKQQKRMDETHRKMEQQRLEAVINAQEEERKRISAELHDGIGQMLSAVKLNLSLLKNEQADTDTTQYLTAIELIDRSCSEVRTMSHTMMPAILVKLGLVEALREMAGNISRTGKVEMHIDDQEVQSRFSENIEINLYRVVQELTNNILKYSNASEIQVQFSKENEELQLMIEDDGAGFDAGLLEQSKGNGWFNIQSRIAILKGQIEIDTHPDRKGTVIFITLPYSESAAA